MYNLNAILVENNPYDRAVIDAALEQASIIKLYYSAHDCAGSLELAAAAWEIRLRNSKPDLVLLDLALGSRCEEELPKASFQMYIREAASTLRSLIDRLEEEQDDMVQVVKASYFICEALTLTSRQRGDALRRLSALELTEEVRGRIQGIFKMLEIGKTPSPADMDAALIALWSGKKAIADLSKYLSRAPSLWRLIVAIASNPDVCFFVISHYATPAIREPLKDLLAARIQAPDPDFYSPFIINKSDLSHLGERLVKAYGEWHELAALVPVTQPFASLPVLHDEGSMRFDELIRTWNKEHLAWKVTPRQTVLWDETGTLEGGVDRWKAIQKRWRSGLEVRQQSLSGTSIPRRNMLITEPQALNEPTEGASWATATNAVLAARANAKKETVVLVRGTHVAYVAAIRKLSGVTCYRIPAFHDRAFAKKLPLREMIGKLLVTSDGDTYRIGRWNDALSGEVTRPLRDVLIALCPDSEKALDRMVYYLEQASKTELNAFNGLLAKAESVLQNLRLTGGQEWKKIFNSAKMPGKERIFGGS